jgi:hypothetical protein
MLLQELVDLRGRAQELHAVFERQEGSPEAKKVSAAAPATTHPTL